MKIVSAAWQHPWVALLLAPTVCLAVGFGALGLVFESSYRGYFDVDDPLIVAFDEVRTEYGPSDSIAFLVRPKGVAAPDGTILSGRQDTVFCPAGLDLIEQLTVAAWQLPWVRRVDSMANFQFVSAAAPTAGTDAEDEEEEFRVAPLFDAVRADRMPASAELGFSAEDVAEVRRRALSQPLLAGGLVARDGTLGVVRVTVTPGHDALGDVRTIVTAARELARSMDNANYEIHVSGILAMNYAFFESSQADYLRLGPLVVLILVGVVWFVSGSWLATGYVLLVAALSISVTLGVTGWLGFPLTTVSAIAPLIVVTLALASCIHLVLTMVRLGASDTPDAALAGALAENWWPIVLTSLTSAVGFLSLYFASVPTLRHLGVMVAAGAVASGVLAVWLLPALIRLRAPVYRGRAEGASAWFGALPARLARVPRWTVLAVVLVIVGLTPVGLSRLHLDDAFVNFFSERTEFRQAADLQGRHLAGLFEIEFSVSGGAPGAVHSPAYLNTLKQFVDYLRSQPEVRFVSSWTDVVQQIHEAAQPDAGPMPADPALAAQYFLLYQMGLPFGQDAMDVINVDESATRLVAVFGNLSSAQMLEMERRILAWWEREGGDLTLGYGAINLMFSHLSERNVLSMLEANLLAVVVMGVLLIVALRSLRLGLLSLVLNLLPPLLAFAIWGLAGIAVGLSVSVAVGMSLAVIIDDTVHLLTRLTRARRAAVPMAEALSNALQEVGPAITATTVALGLGFFVLGLSYFQLNVQLGLMSGLTIVLAWLGDLLLLPLILMAVVRRRRDRQAHI